MRCHFFTFALTISLSSLAFAISDGADPVRFRALEVEVEAASQQSRSIKLDQELLEERVRDVEQMMTKLRQEISVLSSKTQVKDPQPPATAASNEKLSQWQQQTDRNIAHLQQSLQALAMAIGQQAPAGTPASTSPTETTIYLVKSGDSLEKIARRHNTSVEVIKKFNNLKSNKIQVGQKIKIPQN